MSQPIHYCTYFDHRYLVRALCLYDSLCEHSPPFVLNVLALSGQCEQMLQHLNLPGIQVTSLAELEAAKPELLEAKNNRSIVEYYFTLTSAFCRYLIDGRPAGSLLTYLDSDLYFFQSPDSVFRELENSSVGIIEHRFSQPNRDSIRYGRFNVGWVSFRNDHQGLQCLDDWYTKCLNWCCDRVEEERFADQKYLDNWPRQFRGVRIIEHRGANVGPWNVIDFRLQNRKQDNPIATDETALIFYHFQYVRRLGYRTYSTGFDEYKIDAPLRSLIIRLIYRPYLRRLHKKEKWLRKMMPFTGLPQDSELRDTVSILNTNNWRELLWVPFRYAKMIFRRSWITVWS